MVIIRDLQHRTFGSIECMYRDLAILGTEKVLKVPDDEDDEDDDGGCLYHLCLVQNSY